MYTKNTTSFDNKVKSASVTTYPNHEAIIEMKCRQSGELHKCNNISSKSDTIEKIPVNKDKDENLLMLILTLMLSLDDESDGMVYLLIAMTMFTGDLNQ